MHIINSLTVSNQVHDRLFPQTRLTTLKIGRGTHVKQKCVLRCNYFKRAMKWALNRAVHHHEHVKSITDSIH